MLSRANGLPLCTVTLKYFEDLNIYIYIYITFHLNGYLITYNNNYFYPNDNEVASVDGKGIDFFYFLFINVDIRVSVRVLRLISQALKLITI